MRPKGSSCLPKTPGLLGPSLLPKLEIPCILYTRQCPYARYEANQQRRASSASSKRWQARQAKDNYSKEAQAQGLKSRAAFKLLQINEKYGIFKGGQTVVDLGYAPGSWSQVAFDRTRPNGRVVGIDIIPSQPPRGVSTIQGNFLSDFVQQQVIAFVQDPERGKFKEQKFLSATHSNDIVTETDLSPSSTIELIERSQEDQQVMNEELCRGGRPQDEPSRVVDVVLSDMSAPWTQAVAYGKRSLSDPYFRMMNTSGNNFRDHAGSMDLCNAALKFSFETLRNGGSFVCKFYPGAEEKRFQSQLKMLFSKVYREKPSASRKESKELYFVALNRRAEPRQVKNLNSLI